MNGARKLRVYYAGLSSDFSHIGDRRRFAHYCKFREIELCDTSDLSDIIVATPLADLASLSFRRRPNQKLVLDMVDGYLSEEFNPIKDFARGVLRSGPYLGALKGFRKTLREFVFECDAVIVASPEQKAVVQKFNSNVHVILDCHAEIPFLLEADECNGETSQKIFWEGQSSNIKHIASYASQFLSVLKDMKLAIVTNLVHHRVADRFFPISSELYLQEQIPRELQSRVVVICWNVPHLVEAARSSRFGFIPIDEHDRFAQAKPENKMLVMWRLGLPTFVSPTQSYARVLNDLGLSRYDINFLDFNESSGEFIKDVLANWSYDKKVILDYLTETHSCAILKQKWDQAMDSIS